MSAEEWIKEYTIRRELVYGIMPWAEYEESDMLKAFNAGKESVCSTS